MIQRENFNSIAKMSVRALIDFFFSLHLAGNCYTHRINDLCYDLTQMNVNEEQCSTLYYSDNALVELDGFVYAEKCRDVVRK